MNQYQIGGALTYVPNIANPFSSAAVADQTAAASSSKSSKNQGLLSDKVMEKILENGIPVDVDNFMDQLATLEQQAAMGITVNKSALYSLQAEANRIIKQNDYLKKAEEQAIKNSAIGEIAVGTEHGRAQLYVLDNQNKIKTIDVSNYDSEKHGPALTVNELIEHRKFNPSRAFDTTLTQTINNSIGLEPINDWMMKLVKQVGTAETTEEAYIDLASYIGKEAAKKPTEQQLQSVQKLYQTLQKLGPDAIFKNKEILKDQNIRQAFNYIQAVMPKNMKMQLMGRYVADGGELDNSGNYMQSLIAGALAMAEDSTREEYINYEDSINKAAGTTAGTASEQKRNLKQLDILVQGSLNKIDYNLVSSKNPSLGMTLHGNSIGALTNFDNNIVPKAPMSTALESSIGPLIDKQHVTMGSQKINESMFDTILYDGNDVINVWAPTDANGDIDLSGLKQFNEILAYFDSDPSLSVQDKNNILAQYGISGKIDESGNFIGGGNMSQFLVFTGITSDEVLSDKDAFVDTLDSDQKKYELDQIERVYGYLNGKNKNKKGQLEFKKGWFNWTTDILRAPVFMKLKPTAQTQVGAFGNHGPLAITPTYQDYVTMDQMRYNQSRSQEQIYTPSTSLLFQE